VTPHAAADEEDGLLQPAFAEQPGVVTPPNGSTASSSGSGGGGQRGGGKYGAVSDTASPSIHFDDRLKDLTSNVAHSILYFSTEDVALFNPHDRHRPESFRCVEQRLSASAVVSRRAHHSDCLRYGQVPMY
jgi:hypothetical protein